MRFFLFSAKAESLLWAHRTAFMLDAWRLLLVDRKNNHGGTHMDCSAPEVAPLAKQETDIDMYHAVGHNTCVSRGWAVWSTCGRPAYAIARTRQRQRVGKQHVLAKDEIAPRGNWPRAPLARALFNLSRGVLARWTTACGALPTIWRTSLARLAMSFRPHHTSRPSTRAHSAPLKTYFPGQPLKNESESSS